MNNFKNSYLVATFFVFSISSVSLVNAKEIDSKQVKVVKDAVAGIKKECTDHAEVLSTAKLISYHRQGKELSKDNFNDFFLSTVNQCIFVQNYLTLKMLSEFIDDKKLKEKNNRALANMLDNIIETF